MVVPIGLFVFMLLSFLVIGWICSLAWNMHDLKGKIRKELEYKANKNK